MKDWGYEPAVLVGAGGLIHDLVPLSSTSIAFIYNDLAASVLTRLRSEHRSLAY